MEENTRERQEVGHIKKFFLELSLTHTSHIFVRGILPSNKPRLDEQFQEYSKSEHILLFEYSIKLICKYPYFSTLFLKNLALLFNSYFYLRTVKFNLEKAKY